MTLLDTFIMSFGTEGLAEIAKDITDTEKKIDTLEKEEKKLNKTIKDGTNDTVKARKELAHVQRELRETKDHLDDVKNSTGGVLVQFKSLTGVIAKIGASFIAFKKAVDITTDFAQQADAISELSQAAQINTDKFQDLSNAIVHYGGTLESSSAMMAKFKDDLLDIQKGGKGGNLKEVALKYNIDTNTTEVDEFLQNVARKMETLSQDKKLELSTQLGFDSATFKLVSNGLENYTEQLKQANKYRLFTKEDVSRSKEFEMTMRDIRMGTGAIGANLAQMLLPAILAVSKVVKNVVDFFVEHGAFIKAVIIGIGAVLTAVAIPSIISMGAALWTALAPILPILLGVTAAIIAFGLVAEDIYKWIKGEPSVAELIFGPFDEFKEKFITGWNNLKGNIQNGIEDIKNFFTPLFNAIKDIFTALIEYHKAWFNLQVAICNYIIAKLMPLFNAISQAVQAVISAISQALKPLFDSIGQFFSWLFSTIKALGTALIRAIPDWLVNLLQNGAKTIKITTQAVNEISKKIDGSHASGLDYVPYNGYVAELHKGEAVLTSSEAKAYRANNQQNTNNQPPEWFKDWFSAFVLPNTKQNALTANIQKAQQSINFADKFPLNFIPLNSISKTFNTQNQTTGTNENKNITFSGDIIINTQATDGNGVVEAFRNYIKEAVISLDDGMLA